MDFAISEEQRQILDTVDRLIDRHLPPEAVRRHDRDHAPPYHVLPAMGDAGLLAMPFPVENGGLAAPWETVVLVQERLGYRAFMAASLYNRAIGFGGMSLLVYGSEAQRERYLPEIMAGRAFFALALTESSAGSDAASIVTRARRRGNGWTITGRKTWISDAAAAAAMVVACRTGSPDSGADGISMFLVPPGTTGVQITPLDKVGNNCLPCFDIGFDEVDVPGDALMGEENHGFRHLMATLHYARAGMAASVTGAAQAAVDIALSHAGERQQFGKPIGGFQVIQHRLVDMQMRVDQARLLAWQLGWLIGEGRPCRREASQAKIAATETLQFVTDHGMQILASAGYAAESDMQRLWRDGRLYSFGEGSNEIQRNIIAKELGL